MNKNLTIVFVFILVLGGCFVFFSDFGNRHRDLPEIEKKGVLRVVMKDGPFSYYTENDTIRGFQYELIKHFADSMGLELKVSLEKDLQKSITGLLKGKYDIIVQNIIVTEQLKEEVNFSAPVLYNKQVLVQRANSDTLIRNHLDLAGKTIHVAKNSPYILRINNLSEEIGDSIYIVEYDTANSSTLLYMVADSTIDYTVYGERFAKAYRIPNLDIETPVSFTQIGSWALRQDTPLLEEAVNGFLNSFLKSETYREIYDRYFE